MSVRSFKFVSPGVFINEIDNSQLPRAAETVGPVIIGRAERGPAMVPIQIDSFSEFVETFGNPIGGGEAEDAWRNGNRMGVTYAAYAAQAYLASSSPVTFVRLLGLEATDADANGKAGWEVDNATVIKLGASGSELPYGVIYHTNAITGVTVSPSATEAQTFTLTLQGAGTSAAATPARGTLRIGANGMDSALGATVAIQGKEDAVAITVGFSNDLASSFDSGNNALTVGLAGGTTPENVAKKFAEAINSVGDALTVTAFATGRDITIVDETAGVHGGTLIGAVAGGADVNGETDLENILDVNGDNFTDGAGAAAAVNKTFLVSTKTTAKNYIRNVLNTNPTLYTSEKYFLGSTFDQSINRQLDMTVPFASGTTAPLDTGESRRVPASNPETPWIMSQHLGDAATFNSGADLKRLFKVHSLYAGEWEQNNFKISISDIAGPKNAYTKYGTFSLEVRRVSDSDSNPQIVERFTGLTLDPAAPSYIAAKIGDMRMEWVEDEGRYREYGSYPNSSRYIRIETSKDVENGSENAELLPFAYDVLKEPEGPSLSLRLHTDGASRLSSPKEAYFGVTTDKTHENDDSGVVLESTDPSFSDHIRRLTSKELEKQELFSLDFVQATESNGNLSAFKYVGGDIDNSLSMASGYETLLESGFDKFTVPLQGGFDGLDITKIEPFSCGENGTLSSSATPRNSSAYYTVKRAIDAVADPEFVECNMMSMPGISNAGLTGHLINVCEKRADALAVIDIENDYIPSGWDDSEESTRLPKPVEAAASLKNRAINSSYGCAYFPWVQIKDNLSNKLVWVPPSVVAMGTMSSSAANSELWFAPAGFTRGGLTQGSAGLPVVQTRYRLNSKERDLLYESNINPIAQFPAEGIVIFGQKTLQVTPSALDRINVRRLMIHVKKEISRMASTLLFDQNVDVTWSRFKSKAEPFLTSVKARFGLTEYRIILDETTTTPDLVDRNIMYAKIFLKPARAIEFIAIDFVITNSGASFDD